jgi:hypothetical protein
MLNTSLSHLRLIILATSALSVVILPCHAAQAFDLLNEIGSDLESVRDAVSSGVKEGVKGGVGIASGTNKIRGHYTIPTSNTTVTCFEGIRAGYILPYGATSPAAPGTKITALNCDKLASQGELKRATTSSTPGDDIIWPGEPKKPVTSDGAWHGYNEENCPGMGAMRSPKEIRAHAKCVNREMGFNDDWDAMRRKHRAAEAADKAERAEKLKTIQDNGSSSFAKIQAQAARDAAAAQAAATAAQTQK